MGSGIEVVVIACLVGAFGFWLGWTMKLKSLYAGDGAGEPLTPYGIVDQVPPPPPNTEEYRLAMEKEMLDIRVDAAAVIFAEALVGREDTPVVPVLIVARARELAEALVSAECAASRRRPIFA